MFYSEAILARRGPLAKVWLAAHMEKKLSKTQTLQTDIKESVVAILGQEVEIMALRLSGQLLLGVVRIYSRKAKYLLDDCNEALLKIRMAFRPGVVDMTEEQLAVNRNAITLQGNSGDIDLLIPDMNWDFDFDERPTHPQGQHVARAADITLASTDNMQFDFEDNGFAFDLGLDDGIGSQDFDLGIDFGDGPVRDDNDEQRPEDETISLEIGRDAAGIRSPRESIGSHLLGGDDAAGLDALSTKSRELSEHPLGGDMDIDFGGDFGGMDIDLGIGFGDEPTGEAANVASVDEQKARAQSVVSSRLSTPPPSPPAEDREATPRPYDADAEQKKRKFINKKQIIDQVTELEGGPGLNVGRGRNGNAGNQFNNDVSSITTTQRFLPRSRSVMRLLEIRQDPLAHFLPTKATAKGTYYCMAPPGLAPELAEMFMRPVFNLLAPKKRGASPEKTTNKRPRLDKDVNGDDEVEQVRRAESVAPSIALGSEALHRGSVAPDFDFTGDNTGQGMDDFQFDVDMNDMNIGEEFDREKSKSRLTTPTGDLIDETHETYADAVCPISIFDERSVSQSQSQMVEPEVQDGKGYSRNTVKALALVRKELHPAIGEPEKVLSFQEMSQKATRRAASAFFFELLVLGTRDCVKLKQAKPFDNIEVRAKDKLWERQRHAPSQANGIA